MNKGINTMVSSIMANVMGQAHTPIKTATSTQANGNHNKNKVTAEYQCSQAISTQVNG